LQFDGTYAIIYTEIERRKVDPMYKKKVCNGYTTVTMYYDRALRDMPCAQCGVMFPENGGVLFMSYTTSVIYIDDNGWLTCTGTYSPTTRKQMGRFLKEYAPMISYQMAKKAYEDEMKINIYTGEIKPLI